MKKIISLSLALMMLFTAVLPFGAFANESYTITCTGCNATLDETYATKYTIAETAEAGQIVYLVPTLNAGEYVVSYSCTPTIQDMGYNSFVMPANDVSISVITGEKSDITFTFSNGTASVDHDLLLSMTDIIGNTVDPSGENEAAGAAFDLNGDEVADVDFSAETDLLYSTTGFLAFLKENGNKSITVSNSDPYVEYGNFTFDFTADLHSSSTYTVIWKNEDGTEFARAENVPEGETVHCERTPAKAGTDEYVYVFKGWTPEEGAVTSDTTYTAVFEQKIRTRTVTWKNWDGKVIKTVTIPVTETPVYGLSKPTKMSDAKYKYTFSKWNAVVDKTTGDTVYTAEFTKKAIPIKLTASNKTFKQKTKTKKYTVTLKIDGKAASNKKLTVRVNGKTYTAKTNKKGQATFVLKITKKGKYNATVIYKGNPKNITKKVKITIK